MKNTDKLFDERCEYALDEFVLTLTATCKKIGITATEDDIANEFMAVTMDEKLLTELYGKAKHGVCKQFTSNGAEEPVFPEDRLNDDRYPPYSLIPCIGMMWDDNIPLDEYGNYYNDLHSLVCATIENTLYIFLQCYAMVLTRDFRGACV